MTWRPHQHHHRSLLHRRHLQYTSRSTTAVTGLERQWTARAAICRPTSRAWPWVSPAEWHVSVIRCSGGRSHPLSWCLRRSSGTPPEYPTARYQLLLHHRDATSPPLPVAGACARTPSSGPTMTQVSSVKPERQRRQQRRSATPTTAPPLTPQLTRRTGWTAKKKKASLAVHPQMKKVKTNKKRGASTTPPAVHPQMKNEKKARAN